LLLQEPHWTPLLLLKALLTLPAQLPLPQALLKLLPALLLLGLPRCWQCWQRCCSRC